MESGVGLHFEENTDYWFSSPSERAVWLQDDAVDIF